MSTASKSGHKGLIYKIAVPSPLRRVFDYLPPATKQAIGNGTRVQVDFGRRKIVGFVVARANESELSSNQLKPILDVIDSEPIYSEEVFSLLQWCAQYYQYPIGKVFNTAIPAKLRSARTLYQQETFYKLRNRSTNTQFNNLNRAPRQEFVIDYFRNRKGISRREILGQGVSNSIINTLEKKGLIESYQQDLEKQPPFAPLDANQSKAPDLNFEQKKAIENIRATGDGFNCFLLDGVTGSGKTEIYMQAMENHLGKGRQCLILVPEIGLTPQTVSRFQERFCCPIATLHSGLTDNERFKAWSQARNGVAGIIIGTRSAVFTPLPNLGLIIVDEEHDSSFKQQDGFRYSARDIAVMRGQKEDAPVILGSATPSLESLYNAKTNKFFYLPLTKRAGTASQSATSVIDTANEILHAGLSEQLIFKIDQHVSAKNQVLLFINRRGYAPLLSCAQCGWVAECSACISQLTVHANPPSIRCHHCGDANHIPDSCPQCNCKALGTIGVGTQKLEKFLIKRFSSHPIIRVDRDSTRSKHKFNAMLEQIHSGEPCILLGTQMLAKGHHFPKITLVAIVDADSGLFSPDFRGQEFMAQTLVQVSGRAGRADRAGEVIIQSRHASHQALTNLITATYSEVAQKLMEDRRLAGMPPFMQLALVRAEGPQLKPTIDSLQRVNHCANEILHLLRIDIDAVGPVPAPMEKRAGRFRSHLLFKAKTKYSMQQFLSQLVSRIDRLQIPTGLRISLDVDPLEMI